MLKNILVDCKSGVAGLFLLGTLLMPVVLQAQDDGWLEPVTTTYAITNIHITQAPGRVIENGTVIIRDGLIEAVGAQLSVPSDAVVVKGDSLFLYAGFIDGLSQAGVQKSCSQNKDQEKPKDVGHPLPAQAGITPEQEVTPLIKEDDAALKALRCNGFTVTQVVPQGDFFPGQAAVILTAGQSVDQMVLKPNSALFATFTCVHGVFPSTIMGLMAQWREVYRNALLTKSYATVYASGRSGIQRPASTPALEAFYPVIDAKMPVLFQTDKILRIQDALTLQKDLNIPALIVADVRYGWDLTARLKAANAGVFLSLALPEVDDKKDKKKDATAEEKKDANPEEEDTEEDATENPEADQDTTRTPDPEQVALEARKLEFIRKYEAQPAVFNEAGIAFGFSTIGVKAKDIHKNLRRMINAGLREDDALAALTINPAKLLGMSDRLGSVDNGKIANLVITTEPYFHEKADIQYMFVDGKLYDCNKGKQKKAAHEGLEGTWSMAVTTPQGQVDVQLVFTKTKDAYTGVISGGKLPANTQLSSVLFDGKKLTFAYTAMYDPNENNVVVTVEGTLEKTAFKGQMKVGAFGAYPMEGTKDPQ